jgi:hypothetical protein
MADLEELFDTKAKGLHCATQRMRNISQIVGENSAMAQYSYWYSHGQNLIWPLTDIANEIRPASYTSAVLMSLAQSLILRSLTTPYEQQVIGRILNRRLPEIRSVVEDSQGTPSIITNILRP